ncbi:MAG: AbrB/MazE/SpoVT family DNA-binding domain-containing protein [Gemmatimonadota bacterium]
MVRKIFRTGNSMVVSLPREMLESIGLTEGSEVIITEDRKRRRIVIAPHEVEVEGVDEEFAKQVSDFIERYRPALEALADH